MDKQRLLMAGKELIRGNLGVAFKSLYAGEQITTPISHSTYSRDSMFFWGADGSEIQFSYNGRDSSLNAFKKCPPLAAVICRKSQCYINGKTWIMNTQGKESQTLAANKLRKLFAKPNLLQTWKQFEAQGYVYQQLFGFNIVLPIIPPGFTDPIDATSLWNIPASMVDIEETSKLFYQNNVSGVIKEIVLNYKGDKVPIDVNKLWFFKDFMPSVDSLVFPESRVCFLQQPINNIIGAMESRGELINYRGARGMLTPTGKDAIGNQQLKQTEIDDLHASFRQYGLRKGQRQFIITSTLAQWVQIGQATKDLMLFEEIEDDTMQICDQYGYPYRLLSQEKSASYNDVKEFKKLLYEDVILGEAENNYEQWNQLFRTEEYNINLQKDYSHLAILQEDKQKAATARKSLGEELRAEFYANLITYNRVLELLGEDTRPGFDKYYSELVSEGMIFTLPQVQQNGTQANQNSGEAGSAAA